MIITVKPIKNCWLQQHHDSGKKTSTVIVWHLLQLWCCWYYFLTYVL